MKSGIHPTLYDVVFIDSSSGAQFLSQSTVKTDETMKIGGKEYFVIKVEISSDTHPFFTGKQNLIDTAGRVDKFRARQAAADKHQGPAKKASEDNVEMEKVEVETVVEEETA